LLASYQKRNSRITGDAKHPDSACFSVFIHYGDVMSDSTDRPRILEAIKRCLIDGDEYFQNVMNQLDEIGRASIGMGMTSLIGGYAIKDPKSQFRSALIELDLAERSLEPLITRFKDGRVNKSHFKSEKALILLGDLAGVDYDIFVKKLVDQKGRESTWYRLKELRKKIDDLLHMVEDK
jgi:hypothetical protein